MDRANDGTRIERLREKIGDKEYNTDFAFNVTPSSSFKRDIATKIPVLVYNGGLTQLEILEVMRRLLILMGSKTLMREACTKLASMIGALSVSNEEGVMYAVEVATSMKRAAFAFLKEGKVTPKEKELTDLDLFTFLNKWETYFNAQDENKGVFDTDLSDEERMFSANFKTWTEMKTGRDIKVDEAKIREKVFREGEAALLAERRKMQGEQKLDGEGDEPDGFEERRQEWESSRDDKARQEIKLAQKKAEVEQLRTKRDRAPYPVQAWRNTVNSIVVSGVVGTMDSWKRGLIMLSLIFFQAISREPGVLEGYIKGKVPPLFTTPMVSQASKPTIEFATDMVSDLAGVLQGESEFAMTIFATLIPMGLLSSPYRDLFYFGLAMRTAFYGMPIITITALAAKSLRCTPKELWLMISCGQTEESLFRIVEWMKNHGNGSEPWEKMAPYARLIDSSVFSSLRSTENPFYMGVMISIIKEAGTEQERESIGHLVAGNLSASDRKTADDIGRAAHKIMERKKTEDPDVGDAVKAAIENAQGCAFEDLIAAAKIKERERFQKEGMSPPKPAPRRDNRAESTKEELRRLEEELAQMGRMGRAY